jgi:hypothetical protein
MTKAINKFFGDKWYGNLIRENKGQILASLSIKKEA